MIARMVWLVSVHTVILHRNRFCCWVICRCWVSTAHYYRGMECCICFISLSPPPLPSKHGATKWDETANIRRMRRAKRNYDIRYNISAWLRAKWLNSCYCILYVCCRSLSCASTVKDKCQLNYAYRWFISMQTKKKFGKKKHEQSHSESRMTMTIAFTMVMAIVMAMYGILKDKQIEILAEGIHLPNDSCAKYRTTFLNALFKVIHSNGFRSVREVNG